MTAKMRHLLVLCGFVQHCQVLAMKIGWKSTIFVAFFVARTCSQLCECKFKVKVLKAGHNIIINNILDKSMPPSLSAGPLHLLELERKLTK